jgi:hypothetical protein
MRYCEDCKWYKPMNTCDAPQNRTQLRGTDLVRRNGGIGADYGYRWLSASFQRSMTLAMAWAMRSCGKRGRWHQSKAPLHS